MARPRSEDKHQALLEAATEIVASHGLAAPTAQIARRAGVAEGTLFRCAPPCKRGLTPRHPSRPGPKRSGTTTSTGASPTPPPAGP